MEQNTVIRNPKLQYPHNTSLPAESTSPIASEEQITSLEGKDLITAAEFIRRRHKQDLETDPLANKISAPTITKKIKQGHIKVIEVNGSKFIDWNVYKHLPFRQYFQMPIPKAKKP